MNGLDFKMLGYTQSGAPYFQAQDNEQYIFHTLDCDGGGDGGSHRWVISDKAPNPDATADLDGDGACNYHARFDSEDSSMPPLLGTWKMFCGLGWEDIELDLGANVQHTRSGTSLAVLTMYSGAEENVTEEVVGDLLVRGAFCEEKAFLDNLLFEHRGETARGAPYFASVDPEQYLFYDPSCDGRGKTRGRWVIDTTAPLLDRLDDLDNDTNCDYHARVDSGEVKAPPAAATWRVFCGDTWKDVWIELTAQLDATVQSGARCSSNLHGSLVLALLLGAVPHRGR